jgi:hypothetical protein
MHTPTLTAILPSQLNRLIAFGIVELANDEVGLKVDNLSMSRRCGTMTFSIALLASGGTTLVSSKTSRKIKGEE